MKERLTERVVHVEHKVEKDSKGPHINFETINFVGEDLRRHVVLSSEHSAAYIV